MTPAVSRETAFCSSEGGLARLLFVLALISTWQTQQSFADCVRQGVHGSDLVCDRRNLIRRQALSGLRFRFS